MKNIPVILRNIPSKYNLQVLAAIGSGINIINKIIIPDP
jgi:hypothetical protein